MTDIPSSPTESEDEVRKLIERVRQLESPDLAVDAHRDLHAIADVLSAEIESKKDLKHALKNSESKYLHLVDNSYDGIALVKGDRLVSTNLSVGRITGRTREELTSRPFLDFIHPDDRAMVAERQRRRIMGEDVPEAYEFRVIAVDDAIKWILIKAIVIEIEGEPATLCFFHDLTDRKQTEQDLRITKFAIDTAAFSVLQINSRGRIKYCNETAAKSLGYSVDEILEMSVTDIDAIQSRDDFIKILSSSRKEIQTIQSAHRRKDGSTFPVEVSTSYFDYNGEEYFFAFARDVSERKRSENERARMEVRIRQQQKIESISTLASGVAHEINNPINIVMNYAELIISRHGENTKIATFAQEIIDESQRIATIVRNLLAFAREEGENQQLTEMADVVEQTLSLMREVLRKNGIDLIVDVEDDLPLVICRFQQIQQVMMNLITNARDALEDIVLSDGEKKTIRVSVHRHRSSQGHWIRTSIEDNGVGVLSDIADRIFDPFFTTKPRERGTGLGLSVSHGIVSEHGGQLSFSSKQNEYTRFFFDLPVP